MQDALAKQDGHCQQLSWPIEAANSTYDIFTASVWEEVHPLVSTEVVRHTLYGIPNSNKRAQAGLYPI